MVVEKEVSEIVEEVKKHRLFYMQSGGGITFSGGETTMQREFLNELSETLYDMGFHLAMETCGYFDFDALKPVLQRMDLIFMDLKHMDSEKHAYFTGVGNEKILENIKRLKDCRRKLSSAFLSSKASMQMWKISKQVRYISIPICLRQKWNYCRTINLDLGSMKHWEWKHQTIPLLHPLKKRWRNCGKS